MRKFDYVNVAGSWFTIGLLAGSVFMLIFVVLSGVLA